MAVIKRQWIKVNTVSSLLALILLGTGIAALGYMNPVVLEIPVEDKYSDVLLEGRRYKVGAGEVRWKIFYLLESKTVYLNFTSDNSLTGLFLLESSWFLEWEKRDFRGIPRNSVIAVYDVKGYLAEARVNKGDYYLVFDNGEGAEKAYVNYLVEARWTVSSTRQVKDFPAWAWSGVLIILIGSLGLVTYKSGRWERLSRIIRVWLEPEPKQERVSRKPRKTKAKKKK